MSGRRGGGRGKKERSKWDRRWEWEERRMHDERHGRKKRNLYVEPDGLA